MKLPEVSDYFDKQIIDSIKKLIDLVEKNDKRKFVTLVNNLIDNQNLLKEDGFLTLFGRLATELYLNEKSDFLNKSDYYTHHTLPKVISNEIDKEVVANFLDSKFEELLFKIESILKPKKFSVEIKEELHDYALDQVYFYYDLGIQFRKPGEYLNIKSINTIVNSSLKIIDLIKTGLIDIGYVSNKIYTDDMFLYYFSLCNSGQKCPEAGWNTLAKYFDEESLRNGTLRVDSFCRTARNHKPSKK